MLALSLFVRQSLTSLPPTANNTVDDDVVSTDSFEEDSGLSLGRITRLLFSVGGIVALFGTVIGSSSWADQSTSSLPQEGSTLSSGVISSQDYFDEHDRFILRDYDNGPTWSNFLPGVAGIYGKPVWGFYVNRGQVSTSNVNFVGQTVRFCCEVGNCLHHHIAPTLTLTLTPTTITTTTTTTTTTGYRLLWDYVERLSDFGVQPGKQSVSKHSICGVPDIREHYIVLIVLVSLRTAIFNYLRALFSSPLVQLLLVELLRGRISEADNVRWPL